MKINGNGVADSTGKQLLQIIPINIVTILAVIGTAYGLYYNLKGRITALETYNKEVSVNTASYQKKLDDLAPMIIRTDVNVQWLMNEQSPRSPKAGPPK
jgi:hypothetical protein